MPLPSSSAILSALLPISCRTSRVCSPSNGGAAGSRSFGQSAAAASAARNLEHPWPFTSEIRLCEQPSLGLRTRQHCTMLFRWTVECTVFRQRAAAVSRDGCTGRQRWSCVRAQALPLRRPFFFFISFFCAVTCNRISLTVGCWICISISLCSTTCGSSNTCATSLIGPYL